MAKVPYGIAENFNRLSRVHERYRQTDRQTYSEREREFTFAKKLYTFKNGPVFWPTLYIPFFFAQPTGQTPERILMHNIPKCAKSCKVQTYGVKIIKINI